MRIELTREEAAKISAAHMALTNAQLMQRTAEAEYRSALHQAQATRARYSELMEKLAQGVCERNRIPYTSWQLWDFEEVDTTEFHGFVEIPELKEDKEPETAESEAES